MKDKFSIAAELEAYFSPYFDIKKDVIIDGEKVYFEGSFHSRSEKYFISPSVNLWAAETNEYMYVVTENFKSCQDFINCRSKILNYAMAKIKPHKEHMCTYITLILLSDYIDSKTANEIRRFKKYKSFLFSFHGYMHFRAIAADTGANKIYYNPMGKDIRKTLLQFCGI